MLLTVQVPEWDLEDSRRVLRVGDRMRSWLTFEEAERRAPAPERLNVVRGIAVPLSSWPGAELGRHPVRIDVDGGALYWDAPERLTGPIEVRGTISAHRVDAPDGLPETTGVLRRVRMVWTDVALDRDGRSRSTGEGARYEEVAATYFPADERAAVDPEVEAGLLRMARWAYDRASATGQVRRGESSEAGLKVASSRREIPAGTAEARWTGALIDLATVDGG